MVYAEKPFNLYKEISKAVRAVKKDPENADWSLSALASMFLGVHVHPEYLDYTLAK